MGAKQLWLITFWFSSIAQSCPTLCDPMDCSMPGLPVHHQLRELAQTHVHWVSDAIQPSHPLLSPSPPAFSLSQHQGLFWLQANIRHYRSKNEQMSQLRSQLLSGGSSSLVRASVTEPESNWNQSNPPPVLTGHTISGKVFNHSELSLPTYHMKETYFT